MKIASIIIGRAGSSGFKGKNFFKLFGEPMCYYPMIAAKKSKQINKHFVATDCPKIKSVAKKLKFNLIHRPDKLNNQNALGDDVFKYAVEQVKKMDNSFDIFVLLFANAPTINTVLINKCINKLKKNKNADSCITVSKYNMWSPIRARKISKGYLIPFTEDKKLLSQINCDRDSQGDVLFADGGVSVVKYRCFKDMKKNLPPMRWMGKKILSVKNDFGLDVDYSWQVGQVKDWLKKNGTTKKIS